MAVKTKGNSNLCFWFAFPSFGFSRATRRRRDGDDDDNLSTSSLRFPPLINYIILEQPAPDDAWPGQRARALSRLMKILLPRFLLIALLPLFHRTVDGGGWLLSGLLVECCAQGNWVLPSKREEVEKWNSGSRAACRTEQDPSRW